ncbi:hypothetical protein ACTFIW_008985 [Dictyostelium discoideum]
MTITFDSEQITFLNERNHSILAFETVLNTFSMEQLKKAGNLAGLKVNGYRVKNSIVTRLISDTNFLNGLKTLSKSNNDNKKLLLEMSDNNIEFSINDVLLNQESLQKKAKYICHIACQQCWEKSLETKKECMTCKSEVNSLNDLSRCLVVEQDFGKKECCCIYSFTDEILNDRGVGKKFKRELIKEEENGCKEILKVGDLHNHIQNCKFKFVKCPNDKVFRLNSFGEHENECTFKLVTCEYCKKNDIKKDQVENHHKEVCPKVKIDCLQCCQMKIERDQMKNHIDNNCENTNVNCKYHDYGCKVGIKRSELQNHLENVNHQKFMVALIEKLTSHIEQSNKIQNELVKKIDKSKKDYDELSNRINQSKKDYDQLKQQVIKNDENYLRSFSSLNEFSPQIYKNTWIISNYASVAQSHPNGSCHRSSPFSSHGFQILLYPHGVIDSENKGFISIFITLESMKINSVKAEFSLTFVNKNKFKSITKRFLEVFFSTELCGINSNSLNSSLITKENGWLSEDGKLTIEIEIKILNQTLEPIKSF